MALMCTCNVQSTPMLTAAYIALLSRLVFSASLFFWSFIDKMALQCRCTVCITSAYCFVITSAACITVYVFLSVQSVYMVLDRLYVDTCVVVSVTC